MQLFPTLFPVMATFKTDVECVLAAHSINGESPVWSAAENCLYWVDVQEPSLHRFDPATGKDQSWLMPSWIGCAALGTAGRVLVALRGSLGWLDTRTGELTMLIHVPFDSRRFFSNDGKTDPQGRFWFGPMGQPLDERFAENLAQTNPLYRFDHVNHRLVPTGQPVAVSNGLAWSADGKTMYHSATKEKTIYTYEFDGRDGSLGERRHFATVEAPDSGGPDGGATDTEGCYWSAIFGAGKLLRFDSDGKVEREVAFPVPNPTMPAFGGPGLRTVYVTSARKSTSTVQKVLHPHDGGVFAFEAPAPGVPVALADDAYFTKEAR